jgi:hypothetical protein
MPKKESKYDESPEVPQEEIVEEYDDLGRLAKASLMSQYRAIHREVTKRRIMTPTERAQASIVCKLVSENNANLLSLLEHQFEIKFLS